MLRTSITHIFANNYSILQTSVFLKLKNNTERGMTFEVISAAVNDKQLVFVNNFLFFSTKIGDFNDAYIHPCICVMPLESSIFVLHNTL